MKKLESGIVMHNFSVKELSFSEDTGVGKILLDINGQKHYLLDINDHITNDDIIINNIWSEITRDEYETYNVKKMTHMPSDAKIIKKFDHSQAMNINEKIEICAALIAGEL